MSFIAKTERKYGRYAIHGLTTKLVVVQVLFYLYMMIDAEYSGGTMESVRNLNIGNSSIISDFILLVATPISIPGSAGGILWMFFGTQLFFIFGHALEDLWGHYKFNLYFLTYLVISLVISQGFKLIFSVDFYPDSYIYLLVFMSFATYFPSYELLLFFILPTKVRFLVYIYTGLEIFAAFNGHIVNQSFLIGAGFGTYLLFHLHIFIGNQKQKVRKASYRKRTAHLEGTFHKCQTCGRTEADDSALEFRISDDGEEYCLEHLKK